MTESKFLSFAFLTYGISALFYAFLFFKEKGWVRLVAVSLVSLAFVMHGAALVIRWRTSGYAPMSNMYESLVFFSWAFMLAYLVTEFSLKVSRIGFFAVLCNLALLVYAFSHDSSLKPLMPALQSNWLAVHVITCFLGYGAFAISFLASLLYLTPLHGKLLSRVQLDQIMYRSILFGFPLLTFGVASGAIWANEAWGVYWSWDPKETWALITWFIYALYLHLRLLRGWTGATLAWVAFVGFLSVIFTYLGVSYFMSGLHSYA